MKKVVLILALFGACGRGERRMSYEEVLPYLQGRLAKVEQLGMSCRPSDWADLVLIAARRFDWRDGLALPADSAWLRSVQCHAVMMLGRLRELLPHESSMGALRHFAAAFNDPSIGAAFSAILEEPRTWDSLCVTPPDIFVTEMMNIAPVHRLRPLLVRHAPKALEPLDRDHAYTAEPRALRVEGWAAELTPEGFGRVLDVLGADYRWNDGSPPPSHDELAEIEAHAVHMLRWLAQLILSSDLSHQCKVVLRRDIVEGPLGAKVVAHLGHPNPEIRWHLLFVLGIAPRPGTRALLKQLAEHDPAEYIRGAAASVLEDYDRELGGSANP